MYPAPPTAGPQRAPGMMQAPPGYVAPHNQPRPPTERVTHPSERVAPPSQPFETPSPFSLFNIHVADHLRIAAPITFSGSLLASLSSPAQSTTTDLDLDLDLERSIVRADANGSNTVSAALRAEAEAFMASSDLNTFMDSESQKYIESGMSRPALALGLGYSKIMRAGSDQAVAFANNYTALREMGFSPAKAAGSLVKHRNDVGLAIDMATALA